MPAAGFEVHVGRQVWEQLAVRVVGSDLHRVGNHILGHSGVEPDFADVTNERLIRKSVHGKRCGLIRVNTANVGFVHRGPDLDPVQVFRNQKQTGCIQTGHHCLANIHPPINDDAFDG